MEQWQRDLRKFEHDFFNADLGQAYRAVDHVVSVGFAQNFAARVDERGYAWPPHAPATIAMYGVHDLLILTGRMYAAARGGPGHVFNYSKNEAEIGVDGSLIPYAIVHHVGTARVPRRRVIYANAQTVAAAFVVFDAECKRVIRTP